MTATRTLYGSALFLAPGKVLRPLSHEPIDEHMQTFGRALGARHLLQAIIVDRHSSKCGWRAGAVVDAAHAVTMVTLAALKPQRRRLACANALAAAAFAAAGIGEAHRPELGDDRPGSHTSGWPSPARRQRFARSGKRRS